MNATGPMDIGLYVASRVAVIPVEEILKGMIPFFIPFILSLDSYRHLSRSQHLAAQSGDRADEVIPGRR